MRQTDISRFYKSFPKVFLYASLLGFILRGAEGCHKYDDLPLVDKTPVIREYPSLNIKHGAIRGLYLTLEESRNLNDNGRLITFFDYGFDGSLDRIRIMQNNRKEYTTIDTNELSLWQPLFEKYRTRRFGKFNPKGLD